MVRKGGLLSYFVLTMFKNVLWVKEHPLLLLQQGVFHLFSNCHSFIYSVSGFNVVDDVYVSSWEIVSGKCFPQILCILI